MFCGLTGTQEVHADPLVDAVLLVVILHGDYDVFPHLRFEVSAGPFAVAYDPPVDRFVAGIASGKVLDAADLMLLFDRGWFETLAGPFAKRAPRTLAVKSVFERRNVEGSSVVQVSGNKNLSFNRIGCDVKDHRRGTLVIGLFNCAKEFEESYERERDVGK